MQALTCNGSCGTSHESRLFRQSNWRMRMDFIVSCRRAAGTRFDSRYYAEQHIPLVEKA